MNDNLTHQGGPDGSGKALAGSTPAPSTTIRWRYTLTWGEAGGDFMTDYRSDVPALKQFARLVTTPEITKAQLERWSPAHPAETVARFERNGFR